MSTTAKELADRSRVAADSGDYVTALLLIDRAIKEDPYHIRYPVTKGSFLRVLRRFDESEELLRQSISTFSVNYVAWTELGLLQRDTNGFEAAAFCYEQSIRQREDFNVYTLLANVQLAFDPRCALLNAEHAIKLNPDWDEAIAIRDRARSLIENRP